MILPSLILWNDLLYKYPWLVLVLLCPYSFSRSWKDALQIITGRSLARVVASCLHWIWPSALFTASPNIINKINARIWSLKSSVTLGIRVCSFLCYIGKLTYEAQNVDAPIALPNRAVPVQFPSARKIISDLFIFNGGIGGVVQLLKCLLMSK